MLHCSKTCSPPGAPRRLSNSSNLEGRSGAAGGSAGRSRGRGCDCRIRTVTGVRAGGRIDRRAGLRRLGPSRLAASWGAGAPRRLSRDRGIASRQQCHLPASRAVQCPRGKTAALLACAATCAGARGAYRQHCSTARIRCFSRKSKGWRLWGLLEAVVPGTSGLEDRPGGTVGALRCVLQRPAILLDP